MNASDLKLQVFFAFRWSINGSTDSIPRSGCKKGTCFGAGASGAPFPGKFVYQSTINHRNHRIHLVLDPQPRKKNDVPQTGAASPAYPGLSQEMEKQCQGIFPLKDAVDAVILFGHRDSQG